MKKIKYLLILFILFLCSCTVPENNSKPTNKQSKSDKEEKTTYKTCSQEYIEYIKNVSDAITEESSIFSRSNFRTRYPYLIVSFYPSQIINDKDLNDEINSINEKMFNELTKNIYSSKCGMKYSYEDLDLEFYNYEKNKVNAVRQSYIQFKVLEINNYKSFNEYDESQKNT